MNSSQEELVKRSNNLLNNLIKNSNSVFYLSENNNINKTLLNKAAKSVFEKDRVFVNLYKQLGDRKILENKRKFYLSPRHFMMFRATSIVPRYIVLVSLLIYYMAISQILDFSLDLQSILNIVFFWLICLLPRYTFTP